MYNVQHFVSLPLSFFMHKFEYQSQFLTISFFSYYPCFSIHYSLFLSLYFSFFLISFLYFYLFSLACIKFLFFSVILPNSFVPSTYMALSFFYLFLLIILKKNFFLQNLTIHRHSIKKYTLLLYCNLTKLKFI